MAITTLIFDLGNVVLTNDWHHKDIQFYRDLSKHFEISYDDIERGWGASWPEFRIGKITEQEFWNRFLETARAEKIDIEQAKKMWKRYQEPIENMLDLLKKLRIRYRLASLATISKEWLDFKRKKFGLDSYFDIIISSGHSGLAKPDPKIYKIIIQKLDAKPAECVFIDDQKINLLPAKEMGMTTILFTSQKDFEERLRDLSIEF
jgi:putative hydrolase of the HAD superfamily